MAYHGSARIHQAEDTAAVYVNASAWQQHGRWVWLGNFASAPSAPLLHPGQATLEVPGDQPAPITITSTDISYPDPLEYDGEFTGHGEPPTNIRRRARLPLLTRLSAQQ